MKPKAIASAVIPTQLMGKPNNNMDCFVNIKVFLC